MIKRKEIDIISGYSRSDSIQSQTGNLVCNEKPSSREGNLSQLYVELSDEERDELLVFLDHLGVDRTSGMLVIPSTCHYFYDAEDLKGVKTMVNLKQLNHVSDIKTFLSKIYALLPFNSYFIGCFVDNKIRNGFSDKYRNFPRQTQNRIDAYENGIESRIPFINRMYSFIDFRTNMYLTAKSVTRLFDESGLHLVEMTDMNGLTYFCARKVKLIA